MPGPSLPPIRTGPVTTPMGPASRVRCLLLSCQKERPHHQAMIVKPVKEDAIRELVSDRRRVTRCDVAGRMSWPRDQAG